MFFAQVGGGQFGRGRAGQVELHAAVELALLEPKAHGILQGLQLHFIARVRKAA